VPIGDGLERMRQHGELREGADVPALATALVASVQGSLLLAQVRRSADAFRQATSAVIGYVETFATPAPC
jgi:TetR/AcrR family transcriptional regulator, transcriptional repressor for nem operon